MPESNGMSYERRRADQLIDQRFTLIDRSIERLEADVRARFEGLGHSVTAVDGRLQRYIETMEERMDKLEHKVTVLVILASAIGGIVTSILVAVVRDVIAGRL